MLKPMSYLCPGLHGSESKQVIERKTFGNFFEFLGSTRIVIPLFQRRYCWDDKRITGWWKDVLTGKRDHLGNHNSGNVVVKRIEGGDGYGQVYICIDGQQRLTTTLLLCASIRDAALGEMKNNNEAVKRVVERLESCIFVGNATLDDTRNTEVHEVQDFPPSRLLPSYNDRKSYFDLILRRNVSIGQHGASPQDEGASSGKEEPFLTGAGQARAKSYFDGQIRLMLANKSGSESSTDVIETLTNCALEKMGLTLVDIQNDVNLPQVFLWLQEKTIFGEGALLFNPSPGIEFTDVDLIRNLLTATAASQKGLQAQDKFYQEKWLFPIEHVYTSKSLDMSDKFRSYLAETFDENISFSDPSRLPESSLCELETSTARHVSELEKTLVKIAKRVPERAKVSQMLTYAVFFSFFESKVLSRLLLVPKPIKPATRKTTPQAGNMLPPGAVAILAGKEQESPISQASEEIIHSASIEILEDLANWVHEKTH